jgi:hypothetical protein
VEAQPDRDPVDSAEKHMPGHAGVRRDPYAAIVVAVVAGDVRAFRALGVYRRSGRDTRQKTKGGARRPSP